MGFLNKKFISLNSMKRQGNSVYILLYLFDCAYSTFENKYSQLKIFSCHLTLLIV